MISTTASGWEGVLTRICMATSFAGWVTGLLWLMTRNAWAGVFAEGVALGLAMLCNTRLVEREKSLLSDVGELEKQVVGLRTTIDRMARLNEVELAMVTKGRARMRLGHSVSSSSL
jgi:hypothetical protein